MQKPLSYEELNELEELFDKFTEHKNACLSQAQKSESLDDFVCAYRDDDNFETLEQFEDAVFNADAWDFKCDTTAPDDPQPKAAEENRKRLQNGQEPNGVGYIMKTTFWQDFTIADRHGAPAVQDTFNRAFPDWRSNCIYLTELVLVLNWKILAWHNTHEEQVKLASDEKKQAESARQFASVEQDLSKKAEHLRAADEHEAKATAAEKNAQFADGLAHLYNKIWQEADDFALDNLKGAEMTYFYNVTD